MSYRNNIVKRVTCIAATVLLTTSAITAITHTPAHASNEPNSCSSTNPTSANAATKMMVVGDSISQGSSGDWTWRYRFYKKLEAQQLAPDLVGPNNDLFDNLSNTWNCNHSYNDENFDQDHDAQWGLTLDDAKGQIGQEVATYHPQYLLVQIGINDLAYGISSAQGTQTNLETFIANARASDPAIKFVFGKLLPTSRAIEDAAFASTVADYNTRLADSVSRLSTPQSPAVLASTTDSFDQATDTWDGTHPNANGELKIAAAFIDAVASNFGIGSAYPRPLPVLPTGPTTVPSLTITSNQGANNLAWTAVPGATSYTVQAKQSSATAFSDVATTVAATTPNTAKVQVTPGETYSVRVIPYKGRNPGAGSITTSVSGAANAVIGPSNLTIAAGDGEATLSWTADPNANADSYFVFQRNTTDGETNFTKLPYPVSGTSWTAGLLQNGATYEYKLQSANVLGGSGYSSVVSVTPNGATPTSVSDLSVTPGDSSAVLDWTPVAHATGYLVYLRNTTAGESNFTELPYPIDDGPWTANLLVNGAHYDFQVRALNGLQRGSLSNVASVTPTVPPPAAPTSITATPGDQSVALDWAPAASATGYMIYQRNVSAGESDFTKLPYAVDDSSFRAQLLTNGDQYQFKVQSISGLIQGATSATLSATPTTTAPSAPTGLAAVGGEHRANLVWDDMPRATSYYIYQRDVTAGETNFTKLQYPIDDSQWTASLLRDGATYQYKIQSYSGHIAGGISAAVTVTATAPAPAAPTLSGTASHGKVALSWSMPDRVNAVYIQRRNVTAGDTGFTQLPYPISDRTFTDSGLTNGANYQYRVKGYDDLIAGATSNTISVTPSGPAPRGPENLAVQRGNRSAVLSWTGASQATGYYVWINDGSGWTKQPTAISGETWTVRSLVNGADYSVKLQSVDGYIAGGFSNVVSFTPAGPTPLAPTDLSGKAVWTGSAVLRWTQSSTASAYFVYMADVTNGDTLAALPIPITGATWTAGLLVPGHQYKFQLQAFSDKQAGQSSNVLSLTVPLPPRPASAVASPVIDGSGRTKVSWTPISGAQTYYIWRGDDENSMTRLPYPVTGTSFVSDPTVDNTKTCFAVSAVRSGQSGPRSTLALTSCARQWRLNPYYNQARQLYLTSDSHSATERRVQSVSKANVDPGILLIRPFIADTGTYTGLLSDRDSLTANTTPLAPSRAVLAWAPALGRFGIESHPSCGPVISFVAGCKDALSLLSTTGSIAPKKECGSGDDFNCLADNYDYSKYNASVSSDGRTLNVRYQLANSYGNLPLSGLVNQGAIDGSVGATASAGSFSGNVFADNFPSYDIVRFPHYSPAALGSQSYGGEPSSVLLALIRQRADVSWLCTSCYGQRYTQWSG